MVDRLLLEFISGFFLSFATGLGIGLLAVNYFLSRFLTERKFPVVAANTGLNELILLTRLVSLSSVSAGANSSSLPGYGRLGMLFGLIKFLIPFKLGTVLFLPILPRSKSFISFSL